MIATLCSHLSGNPVQHGIKFWMASLNFALITEMGCCLPVGKHSDGSPTFVTNNAKVVNLRAMIRYGWALRASVCFLWFAGVHARNHIFKL